MTLIRSVRAGFIRPESKVKDIIESYPAARPVLAKRGLDLRCCGGHRLRLAAKAHGCDLDDLLDELEHEIRH